MNRTILRFFYICILLIYVVGCATTASDPSSEPVQNEATTYQAEGAKKQRNETLFVDMCRYGIKDYKHLKKRFEDRFKVGADANSLISILEGEFELKAYDRPFFDPLYHKKGEKPEVNSRFFGYTKRCDKDGGNVDLWYIMFFTNPNHVITATEFRLIFDDENFALRGIPFNFDHFYNKSGQKALWNLTGKGTTKKKVEALMANVQEGEYGRFQRNIDYSTKRKIIYRYYRLPEKSLSARLALYQFIWVIIWEFDDYDRLIKLTINI